MLTSETSEERLINTVIKEGNSVNRIERVFYMKEGTIPSSTMRSLKMMGWKGQYEIR